jgi:transcriptional regulator GlxA family with amidase domain
MPHRIAILVFDDVELLDFAGPYEIFAAVNEVTEVNHFDITLVSAGEKMIKSYAGPRFETDISVEKHPKTNWDSAIIVPGGTGSRIVAKDPPVIDWIKQAHVAGATIASVCTGARVMGAAGFLAGKPFTTHHGSFDELAEKVPTGIIDRSNKVVDLGSILTSGGVSSGMDMSLHLVRRYLDEATAWKVADYVEYRWRSELIRVV